MDYNLSQCLAFRCPVPMTCAMTIKWNSILFYEAKTSEALSTTPGSISKKEFKPAGVLTVTR